MFADDAKLYSAIETPDDQEDPQDNLFDSCGWDKDWLLEYNVQEFKCILCGNVKCVYIYKMTNKGNEITSIEEDCEEKDLGILFEKNLI